MGDQFSTWAMYDLWVLDCMENRCLNYVDCRVVLYNSIASVLDIVPKKYFSISRNDIFLVSSLCVMIFVKCVN